MELPLLSAIAGITAQAWKIGSYIYDVCQGAKTIDKRVKSMREEVDALARACEYVHAHFGNISDSKTTKPLSVKNDHVTHVRAQVAECQKTLEELDKMIRALWPRSKSFWDRASRQIDLQDSKEQFEEVRARIRSHTDALHLTLLVVAVKVAEAAPDRVATQLSDVLEDLGRRLDNIGSKLDKTQALKESFHGSQDTLVNFAKETLRSGRTLYEASVAGSVIDAESVAGGDRAANTNLDVAAWISAVCLPEAFDETTLRASRLASEQRDDATAKASAAFQNPDMSFGSSSGSDSDSPQLEIALTTFQAGTEAYLDESWARADRIYRRLLKHLSELPIRHTRKIDSVELRYRTAFCAYRCGHTDQAKSEIDSLLQLSFSDEQRVQQCNAYHLLAMLYVQQNELARAQRTCESTLKARSRLLGKQHESYFESVALLSRILQLLDDGVMSKMWASMIPEANREQLVSALASLQPLPTSMENVKDSNGQETLPRTSESHPGRSTPVTTVPNQSSSHETLSSSEGSDGTLIDKPAASRDHISIEELAEPDDPHLDTPTQQGCSLPGGESTSLQHAPEADDLRKWSLSLDQRQRFMRDFHKKPQNKLEELICQDSQDEALALLAASRPVSRPAKSAASGGQPRINVRDTHTLHLAVIFRDVRLVQELIKFGFRPSGYPKFSFISFVFTANELALATYCEPLIDALGTCTKEYRWSYRIAMLLLRGPVFRLWPPPSKEDLIKLLELCIRDLRQQDEGPDARKYSSQKIAMLLSAARHLPYPYRQPVDGFLVEQMFFGRDLFRFGETPLGFAIRSGQSRAVRIVLAFRDSEFARKALAQDAKTMDALLYVAVMQEKLEIIRILVDAGANPDGANGVTEWLFGIWRPRPKETPRELARELVRASSRAKAIITALKGSKEHSDKKASGGPSAPV